MRHSKDYTITAIMIVFMMAVISTMTCCTSDRSGNRQPRYKAQFAMQAQPPTGHVCKDMNHITCDGECTCDGMECPNPMPQISIKQINIDDRGFISVRYASTDGQEYAYDYMTSEQFQNIFGFIISMEN
jgi:hypothetical protein